MSEEDLQNVVEDEATQEEEKEENRELEADRRKIWVQIDPYYYLTGDRYNPVILVRFTHPNQIRREDGELLNNKRWYFSTYSTAIKVYAQQYALDHGHEIKEHDLTALKKIAVLVDDAFDRGLKAVKKFDDEYKKQPQSKIFGRRVWNDSESRVE